MKLIVNKAITIGLVLVLTIAALMATVVPVNSQDNQSNLLQYEWPSDMSPIAKRRFSEGPGPTAPTRPFSKQSHSI